MLIANKINTHFQDINSNERKILFAVLDNKSIFSDLTIEEFAQKNNVSKSFIIRMCQKIGYSGYSEFKFQLKTEVESNKIELSTENIITVAQNDITDTLKLNSVELLNKISYLMKSAPHIYTYGTGYGQRTILEDFRRGIISGQRAITALPTSVELRLNSAVMEKNDILFIVSMSGQTDNLTNDIIRLKDKGVHIVSITEFSTNPLAGLATINLYLKSTETTNPVFLEKPYISYTSLCFLLDLLVKNYLINSI